jgi:FkbM family methyltransferase
VLDIGANAGYYTLLAARRVGIRGRVIAFEPDPANLHSLQEHVLANRLEQVIVLPLAIGEATATASFGGGTGSGSRRLCKNGAIQVQVRKLDDLAREFDLAPQHVKIDVEGHELAVLHGGAQLLNRCRPTIYLSTHGGLLRGVHQACCKLLRGWGYELQPMGAATVESASELLCQPAK